MDKSKTDREFLNNLTLSTFGRTVLQNSSVTGAPCNKTKRKKGKKGDTENGRNDSDDGNAGDDEKYGDKGKSKLNPDLLQLVYGIKTFCGYCQIFISFSFSSDIMDARSVANRTEKLSTAKKNVIIAKKCLRRLKSRFAIM